MSESKTVKELPACPVETTLTLIGDKWKVLILRDLLTGTKRFGELKKSIGNVSQKGIDCTTSCNGRKRLINPYRICRGTTESRIHFNRLRKKSETHSGRHVELGRGIQGIIKLNTQSRLL